MSSRITLILAVVFLFGAVVAGYLGIVVSKPPEASPPAQTPVVAEPPQPLAPQPPAEEVMRQAVVVLIRDVPAYTPIKPEDLLVERLKVAPAGSLHAIEEVAGRMSWRTLTAGTWLSDSHFEAGGALARMIRPNERALALSVDEVIGASGQLSPGDYVDVLLYLPSDAGNLQRSSQVAVPALRILSVGELLGPDREGNPVQPLSADERIKQEQRSVTARTVVVAVPQALLARLMLASQTGVLRLAVRSAEEGNLQAYWRSEPGSSEIAERLDSTNRQLLSFNQLSFSPPSEPLRNDTPHRSRSVEVIRGSQTTQQTP